MVKVKATAKPEGAHDVIMGSLRKRVLWMMLLRVALISVLLGATIIFNYRTETAFTSPSPRFLLGLIALTYFITIIYAVWYKLGAAIKRLSIIQVSIDLVVWGCLTYATGGIASGFTFLFDLWVIVSAVVLGGRASYYSGMLSAVILICMATLMYFGILKPLPDQVAVEISLKSGLYFLAVNIAALFIVATLVNSLVSRLESTGIGLEEEKVKRADLTQLHTDLVRSITVGIATTSKNGEVFSMNPAGMDLLGIQRNELEGKNIDQWLPEIRKQIDSSETVSTRGQSFGIEVDGNPVPIEYMVAPLISSEGVRLGAIVMFSDLTEVRRLEKELEHSRRLAALGGLAASLAHEIRNPLGAVSGSFQLLASGRTFNEDERSLSDIVFRELQRIERLVGDMLNYARPSKPKFAVADVRKLVEEVVSVFQMGEEAVDCNVTCNTTDNWNAWIDRSQMRQVIWNLLRNAAQATASGKRIEVALTKETDRFVIEVKDRGTGINLTDTNKVFEPFFSTKERGIGLGLALCKRIVDEHEGNIAAVSREGGGTIFRISLPEKQVAGA
jgi:two-component system sensor histidine kinase PilS (NtrC family)